MDKPYVFITRRMPKDITARLEASCRVSMWEYEDIPVTPDRLKEEIKQADALFCNVSDRIDTDMLNKAEHLKVIATMAVGYNNIDIQAAADKGIQVAHTPGVLTETTADLTFALLMASARRLPEGIDIIRNNEWGAWAPFFLTGPDIHHARIGIIGMGRIGEAVARRAAGFNMDIVYHNRSPKPEEEESLGASYAGMDELLATSDFVCVQTPYTKETHHLIGRNALQKMKKDAVLINTSRGAVVDETALYEALKAGDIRAAGLDVFENEPIRADHPLLTLPNVTALPHIGSASEDTRQQMAEMTADHILEALSGETVSNKVV
ncbi:2-hydroxyacid dehydrogenase [Salibacterium halotolerans]|uniref:Glyoxylate/hydroxypyruvate reductase B n=1 Tax=Salibacterium halotolerans TaxID=1884432 RepID=A0A1I5TD59_9BACI|nr:D-glycerate dehydrogenase [Salibacterium halotolerans]SFP80627.1 glyoxylate reductase [Salibacterium halotolerans]